MCMGGDGFRKGDRKGQVYITPDGGETLARFNTNETINSVINRLADQMGIVNLYPEFLTLAFGRGKLVNWVECTEVWDTSLEEFFSRFPVDSYMEINNAIPLYVSDTSLEIWATSGGGSELLARVGSQSTLRDVIELIPKNRDGWPISGYILQDAVWVNEEMMNIVLSKLCLSNRVDIRVVMEVIA